MPKDPIDLFNEIGNAEDDSPNYPGKTEPKNRGGSTASMHREWLTGLQSYEYQVQGLTRKFYPIGSLATALGRSPVTIRAWESKGWIPPAAFRTPPPKGEQVPGKVAKGRRLYSEAQVVFLVETALQFRIDDPNSPDWTGFKRHVADKYPRQ